MGNFYSIWVKQSRVARAAIIFSTIIAVFFLWLSFELGNPTLFNRGGAVIVVVAILFESLPATTKRTGGEMLAFDSEDHPTNVRWSVFLATIGTAIWAFGDMAII